MTAKIAQKEEKENVLQKKINTEILSGNPKVSQPAVKSYVCCT